MGELMSTMEMPEGWARATIGELCSKITDGSHNPPQASIEGLPMLSAKNIHDGIVDFNLDHRLITVENFNLEDKRTNIKPGDVLLTIVGALGRSAVVDSSHPKFTLQRSVSVLTAQNTDPNCFRYSLEEFNFQKQIQENAKGTAQKGIYLKKLAELCIPLPPLAEQKVIAKKLDTLLAQVETTKARLERIPGILKRFRQSVLAAAVSGRLTEEWRGRQILGAKAGILGSFVSIDVGHAFKSNEFSDSGIKLLRGQNIEPGALKWEETKFFPEEKLADFAHLFIHEGDIILAMDRPIISTGLKLARAAKQDLPCVLVQRVARFKDFRGLNPEFLFLLLSDISFTNYIQPNQTGSDIPHISGKQILAYEVAVPTLNEQMEIVRRVEQLFAFADTIEQKANAALERVNNLTQSILAKAFRGELTTEWRAANPDLISGENSAAALLERIKVEREIPQKRRTGS